MPEFDRTALHPRQRDAALHAAIARVHDVLVIGAGATGAGCALDAAARGLSTVVLEAGDLAAGTSSRSGKTFHGGLRYLEQLNFGLVDTALHERNLMVSTLAPYLTQPEPFLFPLTRRHERAYLGAGIGLYDAMTLRRRPTSVSGSRSRRGTRDMHNAVAHHRHYSRAGTLRVAPALDAERVRGGVQYYDVRVDDARHTMTLTRTASGLGAQVIRSASVVDFLRAGDRVCGVVARDELTGALFEVRARVVISASGIWAGELQKLAGAQTFRVTPAKGVHLIFAKDAFDSTTGIFARAEDSVIIIRKWWNYWMLGTTDTPYTGDLRTPRAEAEDVDYLLRNINVYLARKLTRADIVGTFAGLRPLIAPIDDDPGVTSALSRDHAVLPGPPGLISVVGGKYTTYRRMAADAVNAAVAELGATESAGTERGATVPASRTASLPVVGTAGWESARDRAGSIATEFGVSVADVVRLVSRYGGLSEQVLEPARADPSLARPLPGAPGYLGVEYLYAVTHEGAMTLEDVLWHRTRVSFETADGGIEVASAVAALVGPVLGWTAAECDVQVARYTDWIAQERAAL